jgi:predicted metal-binding membrane protein
MGMLFVGGAMNLLWAALIAGYVLIEKTLPYGQWTARMTGGLMIVIAVYMIVWP